MDVTMFYRENENVAAIILISALVIVLSTLIAASSKRQALPLPPGPPRDPIVGNEKQRPSSHPWRTYAEWRDKYGDVIYLRYGKTDLIILNSARAAVELLDQRSSVYSSRPRFIMAHDIATNGLSISMTPAGRLFRKHRKAFHSAFGNSKLAGLESRIAIEAISLSQDLLRTPDKFDNHYKRFAASIVFNTVFDCHIDSADAPVLQEIAQANANFFQAMRPEGFLIDRYPLLRFLPRWLSPWRKLGQEWFEFEFGIFNRYYQHVKQQVDKGYPPTCIASDVIEHREESGLSEAEAVYLTGSMIAAGSDSTAMTLSCLTMAACLFPDAVERVQRSIDEHIGQERIPTFDDIEKVVLCKAFVHEVLRWRPFAPGGTPHYAQKEDVYRTWRIPKGATIMANLWSIHNDSTTWDDPSNFLPERHLHIDTSRWPSSRHVFTFGFGRRICPGKRLAMMNLEYASLLLLWAFSFSHAKDADGHDIPIDKDAFQDGLASHPLPFQCSIRPRSQRIAELLAQSSGAGVGS